MTPPLFITVEGLACTGKTTVANLLADRPRAVNLPAVPPEYAHLRSRFRAREHLDARHLFFLSAIAFAGGQIRGHLAAGRLVVVESYLARTVAFHRGMGSTVEVSLHDLPRPDVAFRLTCDPRVRAQRQWQRGGPRHYWDLLAEDHIAGIQREYRRFPAHVIDTTDAEPTDVVQHIIKHRIDGGCACEDGQSLAGHQNLLSALPERDHRPRHADRVCGGRIGR